MILKLKQKIILTTLVATGVVHLSAQTIVVGGIKFNDLNKDGKLQPYEDTRLSTEKRVVDLMDRLSLEDKVKLTTGTGMTGIDAMEAINPVVGSTDFMVAGAAGTTFPLPHWGLPPVVMVDGPAGVRISPTRKDDNKTYYATAFPVGTLIAGTWDVEAAKLFGTTVANEAKEYGADVILAPGMNIMRNPLCGRNYEYYSEDPLITGKMAAAYTKGAQAQGVAVSIKHFAANNSESNRMAVDIRVSPRALREIYLRGFEIAVKEASPETVMSAYNKLNGTATSSNEELLTTVLRRDWGFKGLVMTDWYGGYAGLMNVFGGKDKIAVGQIRSGNDLIMPGLKVQESEILDAARNGSLPLEDLNLAVKRILTMIFESPKMKNYNYNDQPDLTGAGIVARNIATGGMVLLQNNGQALPFAPDVKKVALFGAHSYSMIAGGTGSGYVYAAYTKSMEDGLKEAGYTCDENLKKIYLPHVEAETVRMKEILSKQPFTIPLYMTEMTVDVAAIEKSASEQNMAVITIGRQSGEFVDRKVEGDFELTQTEQELIENVTKVFHAKGKKVVVVLNIGGVVETVSWKNKPDAILLAWQPGQEGGSAVVDILSGKVNPSGKLTMSFPVEYTDVYNSKTFPGVPAKNPEYDNYTDGIYVGYRYFNTFDVKTSYEFGYGLSYTTFAYSNMKLNRNVFDKQIIVSVDVKNTGKVAGKEVVQLYLSAPEGSIDKPVKELKGFAKTRELKPGETQKLIFVLKAKDLASFHQSKSAWIAEKGEYKVEMAASAVQTKQTKTFKLINDIVVEKVSDVLHHTAGFEDLKH